MMEPYGVAGRRRFFASLAAQATAFTALFALTLRAPVSADLRVEPATAWLGAVLVLAASTWIWLLTRTLLAWSVRVEMPLSPLVHRYVFTPVLGLLAAAAVGTLLLAARRDAPSTPLASAVVAARALGGAMALLSWVATGIAAWLWGRQRAQMDGLRAMYARYALEHPPAELARLDRYVEQETRTFRNAGAIVRGSSFSGLGSRAWYSPEQFAWTQELERAFAEIREEALAVQRTGDGYEHYLYPGVGDGGWTSLVLLQGGRRHEANCARCPKTAEVLASLPVTLVRDAMFSLLAPGAVLKPHRDAHNMMLTCQLALTIPPECRIRVAGETHAWEEGKCIVFDTSYEHEVWNRSHEPRVVLLFDFLHPELTTVERTFFAELARTIL